MRTFLFVCLCICSVYPVLSQLDPNWRLVWNDEFNGNSIDTSKWNVQNGPGNVGNGEPQYYAPSQVTVANGNLVITANNVPTNGMSYASGWVDSKSKFYDTYARYEFRAQMAGGDGMWPAIWLLSEELCWPWGAEFDIMEYRGSYPTQANGYYHYSSCCGCGHSSTGGTYTAPASLATAFHVYALEWYPENITWYIDGTPFHVFHRADMSSGFTQFDPTPHYIILNSAMGGGYAGNPDSNTVFPNYFLIDYVRVYHYGATCAGNTCSNHGCCDPNSFVCVCNAGWSGSSCEQWTGSFADTFITTNVQYTPATDVKVNGWGNGYTFYSDTNVAINNGLTLTLTNNNCPGSCAGMSYSSGAWNSALYYSYGTYSFVAVGPSVVGTGFSLGAAGQSSNNGLLEQILFVLTGAARTTVQIMTWHFGYQYVQTTLTLPFDASAGYHNYSFSYNPTNVVFYIDGAIVFTATQVIPNATLQMGAYYTAEPDWYGGPFAYTGPSTVVVSQASFSINPAVAKCSAPTPGPTCQPSPVGSGVGLTADYFDNDTGSTFFVKWEQTVIDPAVNFNWGSNSPASNINADYFSVRWTGQVQPIYSSLYTFYSTSDDGVRLWVNGVQLINYWNPESPTEHSGTITLQGGRKYDIVLEYEETTGGATQILSWSSQCQPKQVIPQSQLYPCKSSHNANGNGLTARYYSDQNLGTLVHTQIDSIVNVNWGLGGPAALNGQVDQFSVQWSGLVQPRYSGVYTFYADSDDGSRVYVNGQLVVNDWTDKGISEYSGTISLVGGQNYTIICQYYEDGGYAEMDLYWSSACEPKQIIPQSQLFSS